MPLRVAVMGCVVNGPGEAREADLGVASGNGKGQIFVKGEVVKTVPESKIVETLIEEAMRIAAEQVAAGTPSGAAGRHRRPDAARPGQGGTGAASADGPGPRRRRRAGRDAAAGHRPGRHLRAGRPGRDARHRAGVPGRAAVGAGSRSPAGRGLPGRSEPDPVRPCPARSARRRRPSPSGPGGPAGAAPRSSGRPRRCCRCGSCSRPHWGPAREVRARQPLHGHRGAAAGRRRAAGAAGRAGRARARCCRPRSRCSPRRSGSARCGSTAAPATAPGSRSWSGPGSRWPGSRTAR